MIIRSYREYFDISTIFFWFLEITCCSHEGRNYTLFGYYWNVLEFSNWKYWTQDFNSESIPFEPCQKKIVQHEVAAANHFYAYKSKQSLSNYFICKINWEKHPHQAVACFLIITYCINLMLHPISQESSWSIKVRLRLDYINSNCSIRLMLQALFFHDPATSIWCCILYHKTVHEASR